jgi:peptide-methionine (S)-S-oxide reductase
MQEIIFGGGCFWCTEALFSMLKGVHDVTSGYAGGNSENPTYDQVCQGDTGYVEVVKVSFDPTLLSLEVLLDVFFHTHDPTSLNKQGNDSGEQYKSVIFYTQKEQEEIIDNFIKELEISGEFKEVIVTAIEPLKTFYDAESYHKKYYERNSEKPYCQFVISPKIKHLKEKYASLIKSEYV